MANISAIKLPSGNTYNLTDNNALPLTGGSVTGPVSFGDSVTMDDATVGNLVVNGALSVTNNLQVNTINGVAVGNSPKFTDTTYSSLAAASGGTAVSLVTTGEKFTWNSKIGATTPTIATDTGTSSITLASAGKYKLTAGGGSVIFTMPTIPTVSYPVTSVNSKTGAVSLTASDVGAAASGHTHTASIATSSGTNELTLALGTKYVLTAGGDTFIFTMPANPNTDAKLQVAEVTSATQYYPIVGTGTTAATRQYDTTGFKYKGTTGTTSAVGTALLELGNSTASGTANNKQGKIIIYGSTAYAHTIEGAPTAARTLTLPNATGTLALTSQIPSVPTSATSSTTGISIAAHGTGTVIGVQSTTTTASKASGANGSASTWAFEDVACDDITAWSAGSGSFTSGAFSGGSGSFSATVSGHVLSFSHTHTAATHGADSHTHTAPSLTYSAKTGSHVKSGGNGTAPSWSFTDVTVPIKNTSASTFVTGTTHTVTDNGHTHTLS